MHYLFNHERERFQRFQAGLAGASDAKVLWNQIFPDLASAEAVEQTLSSYSEGGEYAKFTAQIPRPHFSFVTRALSDGEVHALRALLYAAAEFHDPEAPARSRAELAESLRQEPLNLRAHLLERVLVRKNIADIDTARALTVKYPQAWQAWLILAVAHANRNERKGSAAALERAHSLGFRGDAPAPKLPNVAAPY